MKELWKTLTFVAVAILLTGAAFLRVPDRSGLNRSFDDQGQKFFPDFKDPFACTDLEVIDYDASTATVPRFEVKFKDGKWTIPSHYNYPADAKDRLAHTAGRVIDLTKDTIRSDRAEDHEEYGVIDPLDTKTTTLKGRGKRVTLRDETEKVLADFIIGKEVKDHPNQRYVRVPGQKRTYGVNVNNVELSTKFSDWIETNLLKLDTGKVRKVVFDNYKVDLEQGVQPGETLKIERKDSAGPWTMEGLAPDQELNSEKLSALTTALGDLKIVGVRPKPPGLTRDLKTGQKGLTLTNTTIASLQGKGFYPTRDGRLLSTQGDVNVSTDEGAVYTLRFGEVVFATGEELSAGSADEKPAEKGGKAKDASKKPEGATESRYLMVTVGFDPSLIPVDKQPETLPTIPDDPFQKAPDDPKRIAEEKEFAAKEAKDAEEREKKVADARKHVQDLTERFADWYYVSPGESFHAIHLDRAALVRKKGEKAEANPSSPAMPGLPPGFQLPPLPPRLNLPPH